MKISDQEIKGFVANCHKAAAMGLMRCSSGNISMRLNDGLMLIKASRAWTSEMTEDDVSICRIADGACIHGRKPSVEIGFHSGILRERPECNVVIHFQMPAATTIACMKPEQVDFDIIPEMPFYIGPVGIAPFHLPGSSELADAVIVAMRKHNLAILRNHGQITAAADFDHAIQNAVFFEMACDIILKAGSLLNHLPPEAVQALHEAAVRSGAV